MLLGSNDDLSVVAIVGMPGIGKTTLAQLVYQDKKVVRYFGDNKIWICVSDDFKVERLLNEMVQSIFRKKSEIPNVEGIVRKLGEKLNGKKYLLVLDDVWNAIPKKWEELRNSLIGIEGSKESKIIVTTRSMDVVSTIRVPQYLTHRLHELSPYDSWTMFRKKAFASGGPRETQTLLDIGRRMVEKCRGVPLAINSLGGLLYDKKSQTEWESIEESETWRSLKGEGEILPVLRLSFYHLPSPTLKQCFAYCSVFPRAQFIEKDKLIQLWAGLGYLQPPLERNLEMEDVGNDYFNILLHNSLFQNVVFDENNDIIACKMHDLVHDLALDVSEGSCLTLEASEVKDHPEVQHLSLCLKEETRLEIPDENIGKLRTLFLTGNLPQNIEDVKSIRALSIVKSSVKELSSSICKLIHLKYLDLSESSFEKLPDSIAKLYNLETLRLPPSSNLEEINTEFHKLVRLRHLCIAGTQVNRKMIPTMIGCLTSLQTLSFFSVGEDKGHKIEELGSLSKLKGRLLVYDLQHVKDKEEAERAKMFGKSKITELEFHWDRDYGKSDINYEDVLEGLKPHKNLRSLTLKDFGGRRLVSWMRSRDDQLLQNLVKIKLSGSKLCEEIPILGHLPHLEVIEMVQLDNLKRIGPEFYGLDERIVVGSSSTMAPAQVVFPALRKLTIRDMRKLKEWSDVSSLPAAATSTMEFFPCLEELYIWNCPQLITLPGHLPSIQDLRVTSMYISGSREKVYRPSTNIAVDPWSKNIAILIEHLLETVSKSLRHLEIWGLDELCYLPKQLLSLASLEALEIAHCSNLMHISEETEAECNHLMSLQELSIVGCEKLTCLPKGFLQPTLVRLEIFECSNLMEANPYELCNLTSLQKLRFGSCTLRWDRCWEDGLLCLTSLRMLEIGSFSKKLDYFPWPKIDMAKAQHPQHYPIVSLESLTLVGWPKLKYLPDQLRHLTSLRKLEIRSFDGLEALPEWLGNFSSLESLTLRWCGNLTSLISLEKFQLLINLQSLFIFECPILKKRCEEETGEEWYKIAHIPKLKISDSSPPV